MYKWARGLLLLVSVSLLLINPELAMSQAVKVKSDTAAIALQDSIKKDGGANSGKKTEAEIELTEITIEAVVEKPSVAILPKRIEPQFEEMEFIDRSFEKELKKVPDKPLIIDDRLAAPQKIENLKQMLIQKKKEKAN